MKNVKYILIIILIVVGYMYLQLDTGPDNVVRSFSKAMTKLDTEKMAECMVNYNKDDIIVSNKIKGDTVAGQLIDLVYSNSGNISYYVVGTTINGARATVRVNYQYVDALPILRETLNEYIKQGFVMSLAGANDIAIEQILQDILKEKLELTKLQYMSKDIEFTCIKTRDGWKIEKLPTEISDVISVNLYSFIKSFYK